MSQAGALTFSNGDYIDNLTTDDVFEFASNDKEDFRLDLSGTNIIGFSSGSSAVTLEFNALDALTGLESLTFDAAASTITPITRKLATRPRRTPVWPSTATLLLVGFTVKTT